MKICLLFPRPKRYIHNETFEPLGLLYLASYLTQDHDVKIVDCFNTKMTARETMDILGVSLTMSPTLLFSLEIMSRLKKAMPAVRTVVGGVHATFDHAALIREPVIDYIVLNEGEEAFSRLLQCLETGRSPDASGLVFKRNGQVVNTGGINLIKDLDSIRFPARHLLPKATHKRRQVLSSRGCVHKCIYCAATAMNHFKWRKRSAGNVVAELGELARTFGERFYFADDNFTVDNQRVTEICEQMMTTGLRLHWSCLSRVENLGSDAMLKTMKAAGCHEIFLGVESGSARVLKAMKRRYDAEKVIKVVERCQRAGINTTLSFIIGIPFEGKKDIRATLELARQVPSNNIAFHMFTPYMGPKHITTRKSMI